MSRLLVIGEGIAAQAFLKTLGESRVLDKFTEVHQVFAGDLAPACSLSSTAVAARRGTRSGLSASGDELIASWEVARTCYPGMKGATPGFLTTVCNARTMRRFAHLSAIDYCPLPLKSQGLHMVREEAFIINPFELLTSISANFPVKRRQALVVHISPAAHSHQVTFLDGTNECFEYIWLATGAWQSWMKEIFPTGHSVLKLQQVRGSYAQWGGVDYGPESFALNLGDAGLVYHGAGKRLLLGSSSHKEDGRLWSDRTDVLEHYEDAQTYLAEPLPSFVSAELITGMRALPAERTPFMNEIHPGLFAVGGLHKTGWISAWRLAQYAVKVLSMDLGA